jgi:hypothetical protein
MPVGTPRPSFCTQTWEFWSGVVASIPKAARPAEFSAHTFGSCLVKNVSVGQNPMGEVTMGPAVKVVRFTDRCGHIRSPFGG